MSNYRLSYDTIEVPSNVLIHSSLGTGAVYSFDPVGSYERESCRAAGAAQSLVQPFLDNQVSSRSIQTFVRSNRTYTWTVVFPTLIRQNPTLFLFCAPFAFCLHQSDLSLYRSTSKIRRPPLAQPSQNTCHYLLSCPSWSIHLLVQLNDTLRFVLFPHLIILLPVRLVYLCSRESLLLV